MKRTDKLSMGNDEMLMKEIKEDLNKCRGMLCS
jgi:hypothetical protein